MAKDNTSNLITLFDGDVQHLFKQGNIPRTSFEASTYQSAQETQPEGFEANLDDLILQ